MTYFTDKEKELNDSFMKDPNGYTSGKLFQLQLDKEAVLEAINKLKQKIRLTSNRDDFVKARLSILDMGGIGKAEVYNMIDEIFEKELGLEEKE